ncbi:hypothetical protein [Paraglaciecola aestuariivivens]
MNMQKLNDWLTLFTNIGVLAGIIFLAYEINQNTASMRVESYRSQAGGLSQMYATALDSDVLLSGLVKVGYMPSSCHLDTNLLGSLTTQEHLALTMWFRAHLVRLDSEVFQYNEGTLDEIYFKTQVLLAMDDFIPWWQQFNPELVDYALSVLEQNAYQRVECIS